jgi:hypothetical protein
LAALYSVVVPLGEGPDEPGHAAYVFFLAREGRVPIQRAESGQSDVPGEGHQPPLAYALAAPLVAWLPRDERQFDLPGNPRFTWAGGGEPNAVAHGTRERWPWVGNVLAWHLARLVSVACGAATVVLTYLAARSLERRRTNDQSPPTEDRSNASLLVLGPRPLAPLLAAAFVAFNPQFLFMSALVTNDALLVTLSAALLWLAVRRRTADDEGSGGVSSLLGHASSQALRHALAIGAVLGLALITKQSALLLAPVALLSVLEQSWYVVPKRHGGERRFTLSARHLAILSHVLLFVATTLAVSGWWYWRNWRLYGDPLGVTAFRGEFATQPFDPGSLLAWIGALAQLHGSFWARFGWLNVRPPGWALGVFILVELLALAGWLRYMDQRRRARDESFGRSSLALRLWWPLLALPLLAFAWVVAFALTAGLVAWQGRLLFPALPAVAILLAVGLSAWENRAPRAENRRWLSRMWFLVLGSWFLVALWLPFGVIRPAYPFHTLPEDVALARLGTPVDGRYGLRGDPGAELRGWRLDGTPGPGASLDLALMWHALGRQNRAWTVFVHLVDASETIMAEDNRQPQDGIFPMGQWVAGDWVEDHHPLVLPPDITPGVYTVRVGLFDEQTGERAGVFSRRGRLLGDYLEVGIITVEARG